MAQSNMTEGTTYIWMGFIVILTIFLISSMAEVISNSEHSELTNQSKAKMIDLSLNPSGLGFATTEANKTNISGIDVGIIDEKVPGGLDPNVSDTKNEFSLDFTFGKKKANTLQKFVYAVMNVPEYILSGLFGLPKEGMIKHLIDITDWVWRIMIFIAIVYFVRNR